MHDQEEGHLRVARARLVHWLFRVLDCQYWMVIVLAEASASMLVAAVTVFAVSRFWSPTSGEVGLALIVGIAFTAGAVMIGAFQPRELYGRFLAWRATVDVSEDETVELWNVLAPATFLNFRRNSWVISLISIVPSALIIGALWHVGFAGMAAMAFASLIPAAYGVVISFSVGELLSRPMLEEIAEKLPADFVFTARGLSVAKRLKIAIPTYTISTAVLVVAILQHPKGAGALALTALVAGAVGLALSIELTVLLGDAVTTPVRGIRRQLARVRAGEFDARIPIVASDEMGELARDFNLMAHGLQEREEIRSAFGTYMDRGVVEVILSGQFPPEGVEVVATMLFCDVRGFTSYAENATAPEVIATLNQMFSEIVPIVEKHGGHVDKFLGDGLLAVFGTPQAHPDHADRAVAAGREIADAVSVGRTGLAIGVGVNTGPVVAGPLGGAGRLNFSVIGDAVNVAARVEAATRETGDDLLITAATRRAMLSPIDVVSRGELALKGKQEPLELFAPRVSVKGAVG